jgi:hypothetical protein
MALFCSQIIAPTAPKIYTILEAGLRGGTLNPDFETPPSSNPAPPLQNHMFSLEKRGFRGDSGDSQDDSPRGKAAHKTTQHLQAWTCMDRQESQSNWPEMQKTLGKPGFFSGEDRIRTFGCFPNDFGSSKGTERMLSETTTPSLIGANM